MKKTNTKSSASTTTATSASHAPHGQMTTTADKGTTGSADDKTIGTQQTIGGQGAGTSGAGTTT